MQQQSLSWLGFLGVEKIASKIVVHTAFDCSLIITMLQLTLLCQP